MADIVTTYVPIITREYYRIPVSLKLNNVAIDPTGLTLEVSVVLTDVPPVDADWKPGSWETTVDVDLVTTVYLARAFVGDATTDFPLARNSTYDVWMRITDSPERPARKVGRIYGT